MEGNKYVSGKQDQTDWIEETDKYWKYLDYST